MLQEPLDKHQQRELAANRAKILNCAHCGTPTYYGAMNLISLAMLSHKPVCSFECNKALGQVA